MKLFEDSFTIKGKTYIREYDDSLKKSVKRLTKYKSEYYVYDPMGEYKGFLDNKPLRKVEGSSWNVSDAYGSRKAKYVAIRDENPKYNYDPRVWYLDIETKVGTEFPKPEDADQEISCIQFLDSKENKVYLLSTFDFVYKDDYDFPIECDYRYFETEIELIEGYLKLFKELDPMVIYAWGGDNFDFPYMYNRLKMYGLEKKLSNYGSIEFKTKRYDNGQVQNTLLSDGHYYIDMLDVYKKFVYKNVQDYKLDTIAEIEIGEKKVDYGNYNTFKDFYLGNYKISGKETEEQKNSKIYKLKKMLDSGKIPSNKMDQVQNYIKDKSISEFLWYAFKDAFILKGIEEKGQFTKVMVSMSETMGILFREVMGTLQPWSNYIANTVYSEKRILPPDERRERKDFVGGFVKDPEIGKHPWVFSLDYTSMYPMIIIAYNLSPELSIGIQKFKHDKEFMELYKELNHEDEDRVLNLPDSFWERLRKKEKEYNIIITFGGAVIDNTKTGFIPELVEGIFKQRKMHKKKMLEYKDLVLKTEGEEKKRYQELIQIEDINQMTQKILINSLFGALSNNNFTLFDFHIGRAITGMGRLTIKRTAKNVVDYMQKTFDTHENIWVYGDTDSIYLSAKPVVDYFASKRKIGHEQTVNLIDNFYNKKIQPIVDNTVKELCNDFNAKRYDVQGADREVIASGLFVAKKKYTMLVYDNEGVKYSKENPYLKTQGLEIIKGGTPNFSKKYLTDAITVLLTKEEKEIKEWFNEIKDDFMNWKLEDIAKTQGVSKIYDPMWGTTQNGRLVSIPFGSRAAIATNNYIMKNNLQGKFQLIQPGDKVKMLYLLEPNRLKSDAFAFLDGEFAEIFKKDIDYDTNFQKFFLKPLEIMTEALGINLSQNHESLDDW